MPSSPNHSETEMKKYLGKKSRGRLLASVPEMAVPRMKIVKYICQTP